MYPKRAIENPYIIIVKVYISILSRHIIVTDMGLLCAMFCQGSIGIMFFYLHVEKRVSINFFRRLHFCAIGLVSLMFFLLSALLAVQCLFGMFFGDLASYFPGNSSRVLFSKY